MKKISKKKAETEKKKKKTKKVEDNGNLTMDQWLEAPTSSVSLGRVVDTLKTEKKKKKKKHLSPSRDAYEVPLAISQLIRVLGSIGCVYPVEPERGHVSKGADEHRPGQLGIEL